MDHDALVISDNGDVDFVEGDLAYEIKFKRHKRIKIFRKDGYDFGDVEIVFYVDGYGRTEKVSKIRANAYNVEDGRVVISRLSEDDVFEEKINEKYRRKVFAIPQVKEGTILEFEYELTTPFMFNLPDWDFQSTVPTIVSRYKVGIIPFYSYVFAAQGFERFDHYENYQTPFKTVGSGYQEKKLEKNVFEFGMNNIPAFESEEYITSKDDYIQKIDFQFSRYWTLDGVQQDIMTTYPKLIRDFIGHQDYGKYIKKSEKAAKSLVENLSLEGLNEIEKIKRVVEELKSRTEWNGYQLKYAQKSPKELLEQVKGTSAEINLFLCGMLEAADIEASPVLLSTRDHGKINTNYPFSSDFNYSVVLATLSDGRNILLDATDDILPYNSIPSRCFNDKGLIVKQGQENWIELKSRLSSEMGTYFNLVLNPDEERLEGTAIINSTGYLARIERSVGDNKELLTKKYETKGFQIDDLKTKFYDKLEKAYTIALSGSMNAEKIGENYLITPFGEFPPLENKLTAMERTYPVDMTYAYSHTYNSKITVPEGFVVKDLPENVVVDNDLVAIEFSNSFSNMVLSCSAKVIYKKAVYQPHEYKKIKHFMGQAIKHFGVSYVVEAEG